MERNVSATFRSLQGEYGVEVPAPKPATPAAEVHSNNFSPSTRSAKLSAFPSPVHAVDPTHFGKGFETLYHRVGERRREVFPSPERNIVRPRPPCVRAKHGRLAGVNERGKCVVSSPRASSPPSSEFVVQKGAFHEYLRRLAGMKAGADGVAARLVCLVERHLAMLHGSCEVLTALARCFKEARGLLEDVAGGISESVSFLTSHFVRRGTSFTNAGTQTEDTGPPSVRASFAAEAVAALPILEDEFHALARKHTNLSSQYEKLHEQMKDIQCNVGLGLGEDVPVYLRWAGPLEAAELDEEEVKAIIVDFVQERAHAVKDTNVAEGYWRYLKEKYSSEAVHVAYSIHRVCRQAADQILGTFAKVLAEETCETVLYDVQYPIAAVLGLLSEEAPDITDIAMDEWRPLVPPLEQEEYGHLAECIESGGTHAFVDQLMRILVEKSVSCLARLRKALENISEDTVSAVVFKDNVLAVDASLSVARLDAFLCEVMEVGSPEELCALTEVPVAQIGSRLARFSLPCFGERE